MFVFDFIANKQSALFFFDFVEYAEPNTPVIRDDKVIKIGSILPVRDIYKKLSVGQALLRMHIGDFKFSA